MNTREKPLGGYIIHQGTIEMNGYTLTEIRALPLCYSSDAPFDKLRLKSKPYDCNHSLSSQTDYFAVLGHLTVKNSAYNQVFLYPLPG